MAILTAALDRDFLRIHFFIHDEGPAKYFYPFLAVVAAGVAAAFLLLAMSIHPGFGLGWLRTAVGVLAGGFTLLSLSAIIIALGTLVDFVNAKQEAANFIDVQTLDELIKKDGVEDARSAFKEWLNSRDNSSGAGGS
ncbi:hypothetical protein [Streptomyces sp. SPB4]|uniref:hypothetical protein n=1 Tax=Streptomyces sp. SPB4 TaxID=2940553 RepID=UPI00247694E8|nr:hypothetical protein [Streptomyces sp. SPB4]MDH6537939.1 hypothetical protein [Streptomyces sp. SPB4]